MHHHLWKQTATKVQENGKPNIETNMYINEKLKSCALKSMSQLFYLFNSLDEMNFFFNSQIEYVDTMVAMNVCCVAFNVHLKVFVEKFKKNVFIFGSWEPI